jgi:hypothetical protein
MPSFTRITRVPTVVVTKEAPALKKERVAFLSDPVSSISRPANVEESWACYEFECHARRCGICHKPYEVYKAGEQLCERGHRLAQDVAVYLYNQDGDTVSTKKEDHQTVRVEIPTGYDEVRDLLRAVERSLRHRHREPFITTEKSNHVAPKKEHRSTPVKVEQPVKPKRPLSGEIVDWPRTAPLERRATVSVASSRPKRGSLYEADIAQQQRDAAKYNVEIREPSKGSSGYYR